LNAIKTGNDPNCNKYDGGCIEFAETALQTVVNRYGSNIPNWGSLHLANFQHQVFENTPLGCLYGRKVPHGGDSYTVNVGWVENNFEMTLAPSYRQVVDVYNYENSVFVHPMGQSGNLFSPYFENLLPLWANGQYLPMTTQNFAVDHTFVLIPATNNI